MNLFDRSIDEWISGFGGFVCVLIDLDLEESLLFKQGIFLFYRVKFLNEGSYFFTEWVIGLLEFLVLLLLGDELLIEFLNGLVDGIDWGFGYDDIGSNVLALAVRLLVGIEIRCRHKLINQI